MSSEETTYSFRFLDAKMVKKTGCCCSSQTVCNTWLWQPEPADRIQDIKPFGVDGATVEAHILLSSICVNVRICEPNLGSSEGCVLPGREYREALWGVGNGLCLELGRSLMVTTHCAHKALTMCAF